LKTRVKEIRKVVEEHAPLVVDLLQTVFEIKASQPTFEYLSDEKGMGDLMSVMSYNPDTDVVAVFVNPNLLRRLGCRGYLPFLGHEFGHRYHYRVNPDYLREEPKGKERTQEFTRRVGLFGLLELKAYGESVAFFSEDLARKQFSLEPIVEFFKEEIVGRLQNPSSPSKYQIDLLGAMDHLLGFMFSRWLLDRDVGFFRRYVRLKSSEGVKELNPQYFSMSDVERACFLSNWTEEITGAEIDLSPFIQSLYWKW
jgi:hypothetical protein